MNDNNVPPSESSLRRVPWNKGKLPGAKPPFRPSHVWSIRTKLQLERRTRDLALFNLAIDSKLRGCDVVASASRTWRRMATRSIEHPLGKRRPAFQFGLRLLSRHGRRSMGI